MTRLPVIRLMINEKKGKREGKYEGDIFWV